jgi:hypothetical protein
LRNGRPGRICRSSQIVVRKLDADDFFRWYNADAFQKSVNYDITKEKIIE